MDADPKPPSRPDAVWRPGRLAAFLAVGLCGLGVGCRSNQRYDLLEAELRTRERELLEARAELQHARGLNQLYQRSLPRIACGPPGTGSDAVPVLPLKDIQLGSGTGGADNDGCPGDEALQVVVVPRDEDGTAVKVPARLEVLAFEVGRNGVKTPIGRWDVPPEQLRRTWRGGLLTTGYFVPLQWDKAPLTDRVRIAARLVTLDGRTYEADKDVTVHPLPGLGEPGASATGVPPTAIPPTGNIPGPPGIPPPGGSTLLPPPREAADLPPPAVEAKRPAVRVRRVVADDTAVGQPADDSSVGGSSPASR